jgi:hypothetical protein
VTRWVLLLVIAGCGSSAREATYDMRWELTHRGYCDAPGHEAVKGQTEITLRFVRFPDYFEIVCSTDLANRLTKAKLPITPATFVIDDRNKGAHATCAVADLQGKHLAKGCDFPGAIVSGRSGAGPVDPKAPSPWDPPR